jgi:hypothetical protein
LIVAAVKHGVIAKRFTFRDLRAHYVTEHKERECPRSPVIA